MAAYVIVQHNMTSVIFMELDTINTEQKAKARCYSNVQVSHVRIHAMMRSTIGSSETISTGSGEDNSSMFSLAVSNQISSRSAAPRQQG